MSTVWNKLFGNAPAAANEDDNRAATLISPAEEGSLARQVEHAPPSSRSFPKPIEPTAADANVPAAKAAPMKAPEPTSALEESFDAIGQRNEALRNQLDGIADSFRGIEAIRGQFESVVSPIARLLRDLEETRAAVAESRERHFTVSAAHDDLKRAHVGLLDERNGLAEQRDSLQTENRQLQGSLHEAEDALGEAQTDGQEAKIRIGSLERSLDAALLSMKGLEETNAALRTAMDQRETTLAEAEQKQARLSHQYELSQEEARALRKQLEEQSQETSKMARLHGDVDAQRGELARRAVDLENQLALESSAHGKIKALRQDESETHRAQLSAATGELSAARACAETAERLLAEARVELRDKAQDARALERRIIDTEAATQNQAKKQTEFNREIAVAKSRIAEVEASRALLLERSSSLAKAAKAKDNAMQRAEEKIAALEARLSESGKSFQSQRTQLEAKISQLGEQAQTDSAARAYAEGALQSARRDRLAMQRELVSLKAPRADAVELAEAAAEGPNRS